MIEIGKNVVFAVDTHDPDTCALSDADSAPTYRIYEEETGTAILTGTMAKLDDDNTTGFYTELIAVTTANGFEAGKTYTIHIEATVNSIKGGISFGFAVWDPNTIADAVFKRDMDQVESAAPDHSLTTAVLKSVSRVQDDGEGHIVVYRTDGVTEHVRQSITVDENLEPIEQIMGAS